MITIILLIILCIFLWVIVGNIRNNKKHPPIRFDVYFGVPGSGKTTFAAYIAKKKIKKNQKVLSNVPLKGAYQVVKQDIGRFQISNCDLIIDEAGVDYNNRSHNKFTEEELYFYKYHRHYKVNISLFSQAYNDFDLKLRTLATRYYIVKKSIFPGFVCRRLINKKIGIDKITKQIIDEYSYAFLGIKYIYCPKLWKMFNSYDYKEMPVKHFLKY